MESESKSEDKVAIVLCFRNSGIYLADAVSSILSSTNHPFKLILIDGGSTDLSKDTADYFSKIDNRVEVHHIENLGYVKAMNYGIQKAGDLDVYITQDDVIHNKLYGRDWLSVLNKLAKSEDCGLITTIAGGGFSGPEYLNKFYWFGTWSLYIPQRTIKRVGLFDENFNPGYGDDIEYTLRIGLSGLKLYTADFWVDHHRIANTELKNEDVKKELTKKHAEYFREKYKHLLNKK